MSEEPPTQNELDLKRLVEALAASLRPFDFRTFVIGFERPAGYDRQAHEARFRRWKIEAGEALLREFPGAEVNFHRPDVRLDVDPELRVRAQVSPIFLAGRYWKLSREIPGSRWIHHSCRGRGCAPCSYTGNLCGPSIEELVSKPVLELTQGARTLFHALGREDTDARMLGSGRPFVLEVQRPVHRVFPLEEVKRRFTTEGQGLAEVFSLSLVDRSAVAAVKGAQAEKTYRAWVEASGPLPENARERANALGGIKVDQMSPRRVMQKKGLGTHRQKAILESLWLGDIDGRYAWEVRVESGTYVKELVSGDGGRTRPSLSDALGVPCACSALDVLEVHWSPPWE
jgi:tRNA pseudouridine synthase 10